MSMAPASAVFPPDRGFISPETYDAFFAVVDRLETTIAGETKALAANRHDDLGEFTRQKRQGFLELNRIVNALNNTIPSQDVIARLAKFKRILEANDSALRTHLDAMAEVTDIIVRVMREAESDGTYSRAFGRTDYDFA